MKKLPLFVLKLGDMGPEPIYQDLQDVIPPEEQELFLLKVGAFYLSIIGQGHEKFLGFFGPLPVTGLLNWQSYVHSFQLTDDSLQDERLENVAYCALVLLIPTLIIEELNFLRYHLEILLKKFFVDLQKVSEINETTMSDLQQQINQLRQDFSIEWKEHSVVIKRKIEHTILSSKKSKIKQLLTNIAQRRSVTAIVMGENDAFLRSTASTLIDIVTEWNQRKATLSLLNGRLILFWHPLKNPKMLSKANKNADAIVFIATIDGLIQNISLLETVLKDQQILAIGVVLENENNFTVRSPNEKFKELSKELMTSILPAQLILSRPFILHPMNFQEETIAPFILGLLELLVQ